MYGPERREREATLAKLELELDVLGGTVQVDPGFQQLTPRLLSALETKM